jgi:hypothetical protein
LRQQHAKFIAPWQFRCSLSAPRSNAGPIKTEEVE